MLKKLRVLLIVAAAIVPFGIVAQPAGAHTQVCTGYWGMHIGEGLGSLAGTPGTADFGLSDQSVCTEDRLYVYSGSVSGSCGAATGHGVTNMGHYFTFNWLGGTLYFDGDLEGVLNIIRLDTNCLYGQPSLSAAAGTLVSSH